MGYHYRLNSCCNYQKIANNDHNDNDQDADELTKMESCRHGWKSTILSTKPHTKTKSRRRHGRSACCTWCLYLTVAMLGLFLVVSTLTIITGYAWTRRQVIRLTSTNPGDALPIHPLPVAELELVKDRVKLFVDTILAHQIPEQDLIITQEELNGFIAHSDYFRGNAFVRIMEEQHKKNDNVADNNNDSNANKLLVDMSLPAEGLPGGKGRYFVATGFLDIRHIVPQGNDNNDTDEDKENSHDAANADASAWVTTQLDTKYHIPDLMEPSLWHSEMTMYWQNEQEEETQQHHKKLILNVENGNFLNWVVPQDFIDQRRNLMDYILYNDNNKDDDYYDCGTARKLLEGIDSVTLEDGRIVIHASPFAVIMDDEDAKQQQQQHPQQQKQQHRVVLAADQPSTHHDNATVMKLLWKLLN